MKILIINGSHRLGNTARFVEYVQATLSDKGFRVETLDLLNNRFDICDGCLSCEETGKCVSTDLFTKLIVPKLTSADAYVFAMPIYFNTVPALFKNFIDRTNCLCSYYEANHKKVALFLVGQLEKEEGSFDSAIQYLREYADIMHFELVDNNITVTAREPAEIVISQEIKDMIDSWF